MSSLHLVQTDSLVRIPERIAPRVKEWSNEWFEHVTREELSQQLKIAKESLLHVSEMKQMTAQLIWEVRIQRIKEELKRRAVVTQ